MKWAKARKHGDNYYCWQDILHVMLVTLGICLVVALVIILLLVIVNPKVATAGDVVNFRTARRLAAVAPPIDKVTTRYSEPIKVLSMEITAYSPTVAETDNDPLTTASGKRVHVGGIAADLSILPFGSLVLIPEYNDGNLCEVIDTGGAIRGLKLDVFLWSTDAAIHWGRRHNVRVEVLYIPKEK
jgi:3D (Asp-Asp-Asp) domain-containing protein